MKTYGGTAPERSSAKAGYVYVGPPSSNRLDHADQDIRNIHHLQRIYRSYSRKPSGFQIQIPRILTGNQSRYLLLMTADEHLRMNGVMINAAESISPEHYTVNS